MKRYSVLVPIRVVHEVFQVYLENLGYCLDALAALDSGGLEQEVVVVDYGSASPFSDTIKALATAHAFVYVRAEAESWSRARSLNIGIKNATGDRVFMIDADTLLPEKYIVENLAVATDKNYTVTLVFDSYEQTNKCSSAAIMKTRVGKIRGAGWSHIGVDRAWLVENNGYNPEYVGWGGEDDDIILRMEIKGVKRHQLHNNPVHLWHPLYGELMCRVGQKELYEKQKKENKARYFTFRKRVQKK